MPSITAADKVGEKNSRSHNLHAFPILFSQLHNQITYITWRKFKVFIPDDFLFNTNLAAI